MAHYALPLRGVLSVTAALVVIASMPIPVALATSGLGSPFTVDISGGYQVYGRLMYLNVQRTADQELVQIGNDSSNSSTKTFGPNNEEHLLLAYADSANHLVLCSMPTSATMTSWPSDWSILFPFEEAKVLVLDKKTGAVVGPLDETSASRYFRTNGVVFTGWVTANELSEEAGAWLSNVSFNLDYSIIAFPLAVVVLALFALGLWFVMRPRDDIASGAVLTDSAPAHEARDLATYLQDCPFNKARTQGESPPK